MYCSGCGLALASGQAVCPKCGRPALTPVPPMPGLALQLQSYAGNVRALGIVWLIYAAVALVTGILALSFASAFFSGHLAPWIYGPWGRTPMLPLWLGTLSLRLGWVILTVRVMLAAGAGFGLLERSQWGRGVAIAAAIVNIYKFPFGMAMGIWTLVMMLGYRNSTLYEQLESRY